MRLCDLKCRLSALPCQESRQERTSASCVLVNYQHDRIQDEFGFKDELERNECLQWLFWQMGGQGPMQGQANHFHVYAKEKSKSFLPLQK